MKFADKLVARKIPEFLSLNKADIPIEDYKAALDHIAAYAPYPARRGKELELAFAEIEGCPDDVVKIPRDVVKDMLEMPDKLREVVDKKYKLIAGAIEISRKDAIRALEHVGVTINQLLEGDNNGN